MVGGVFRALSIYHDSAAHPAAMNMAIDEALLESATVPSIRFYQWQSPALSFGYFGRFADVATYAPERDLVRRWTGGGIVFHGEDLTYSIVIPANTAVFGKSSMAIYEKVHRALRNALLANGERAVLVAETTPNAQRPTLNAQFVQNKTCFATPVHADVMLNGRKIAGAAQRRTRAGLLHQGSIQEIELGNGLADRFARTLSANCREHEINEEVLDRAPEIAARKYATDAWLRKR